MKSAACSRSIVLHSNLAPYSNNYKFIKYCTCKYGFFYERVWLDKRCREKNKLLYEIYKNIYAF